MAAAAWNQSLCRSSQAAAKRQPYSTKCPKISFQFQIRTIEIGERTHAHTHARLWGRHWERVSHSLDRTRHRGWAIVELGRMCMAQPLRPQLPSTCISAA